MTLHKYMLLILCALNIKLGERCILNSRRHFSQPLPIILRNGKLLEPDDASGNVVLDFGASMTLSCEGVSPIQHPNKIRDETVATITCCGDDSFQNDAWLNGPSRFSLFRCDLPPNYSSRRTSRTCFEGNPVYEVGYNVENDFHPLYESCFNEGLLNAIYSKYTQKSYNALYQTKVERPFFIADDVYGYVPVDALFSPRGQKSAVGQLVGSIIDTYITKAEFLSRGHLAAKTDFVFAFGQRATFHYVNCCPQWYGLNGGNWNTLEVDLRNHIHQAELDTVIYTGSFGVTQLTSQYGRKVDLHLYSDDNNNPVIPVPLYYYKVVYEPNTKRGLAFMGINGPYYTKSEARDLFFCEDLCRGHLPLYWLTWHPDNAMEGYTFCCTVTSFRNTVHHLPDFEVTSEFT